MKSFDSEESQTCIYFAASHFRVFAFMLKKSILLCV